MSTLERALAYFQIPMARVISSSFARSKLPLVILRCIMGRERLFFLCLLIVLQHHWTDCCILFVY